MAASFCRKSLLNHKNNLFHNSYRYSGYIVLIPEKADELPFQANLLQKDPYPHLSTLTTKECEEIIANLAQKCDLALWDVEDQLLIKKNANQKVNITRDIFNPLEITLGPFLDFCGLLKVFSYANQKVMPHQSYMKILSKCDKVGTHRFFSPSIYEACKEAAEEHDESLTEEEQRIRDKYLLEGSLNGLSLSEENKNLVYDSIAKLQTHMYAYREKYCNAVSKFSYPITDTSLMSECPVEVLRLMGSKLGDSESGPWYVNFHPNVYNNFMKYCPSRLDRFNIWKERVDLCGKGVDKEYFTSLDIEEIMYRRGKIAGILGYPSYIHMAMRTKMAENVESVEKMLNDLLVKARPVQEAQIYSLELFAHKHGFNNNIELWDLPYWSRRQQMSLFGFDNFAVKDYFPLNQVLLGLFSLCEELFGIKIEEDQQVNKWDPDVRFFRISDEKTKKAVGGFYLDPYPRIGKAVSHDEYGWASEIRGKSTFCGTSPLMAMIFNFSKPDKDMPCLLSFSDVKALFTRFGMVLNHTLTDTNYSEVAGIRGMEWDATLFMPEFMTLWLYERGTVESISAHYETGEPLPDKFLNNLAGFKQYMAGYDICRLVYLSTLDLQLHSGKKLFWRDLMNRLWPEHFIFNLHKLDVSALSFKEIYAESHGCVFYTTLWSQVLAADAFSAFAEAGFENQQNLSAVGKRFRSTFLASGSAVHPSEVFRRFRGRDPSLVPLLDILGFNDQRESPVPENGRTPAAEV